MLILKPYAHITIWGGNRLTKYIDETVDNIGHLYTVRGNEGDSNIILNGENVGVTLYDYFITNRERWGMKQYNEFPVSIALVDASENLSIQVHPTKEIAARYEKVAVGKNESFYILEEPEKRAMINGCKCSSKEQLAECVEQNKWDDIIDYLPVQKGEYVYVTAGTLHAMTKGALTYEIEENCTYTYRLYDYDRVDALGNKRMLDTEKAITSIDVTKKSYTQKITEEEIVEERYATRVLNDISVYKNSTANIECLTIIDGEGECDGVELRSGMSVIVEPSEALNTIVLRKAIVARIL